mmetsp:Transcript_20241/g.43227  ORF Transcript_20241/g.43227 Transcript_20241/m.43227 type:complete len:210 (-) Transcript_20241:9-638(-)
MPTLLRLHHVLGCPAVDILDESRRCARADLELFEVPLADLGTLLAQCIPSRVAPETKILNAPLGIRMDRGEVGLDICDVLLDQVMSLDHSLLGILRFALVRLFLRLLLQELGTKLRQMLTGGLLLSQHSNLCPLNLLLQARAAAIGSLKLSPGRPVPLLSQLKAVPGPLLDAASFLLQLCKLVLLKRHVLLHRSPSGSHHTAHIAHAQL